MDQSLRATLALFERSGDLHIVEREVDPRFELGAVLSFRGRGATQLFRQVRGARMPVVGNLLNTREKIARALGLTRREVNRQSCARLTRAYRRSLLLMLRFTM